MAAIKPLTHMSDRHKIKWILSWYQEADNVRLQTFTNFYYYSAKYNKITKFASTFIFLILYTILFITYVYNHQSTKIVVLQYSLSTFVFPTFCDSEYQVLTLYSIDTQFEASITDNF